MEDKQAIRMPLIGDMAPEFHAITTQGEINFPKDYVGKWVVLFSYSADFMPVCTTEFMTFASMINEFQTLNTALIGLSIDSVYSHIAWLRKIRELVWKDIKHVEVSFPIIADTTMDVAKKYGMLHPNYSGTQTVCAVFIIDPDGKVRAISYYPASTGRNLHEIKRMISALQKSDCDKITTPANWMPCDDVILPLPETCGTARERVEQVIENTYCLDWFLSFKQSNCDLKNQEKEPEGIMYPSAYPFKNLNNYRR